MKNISFDSDGSGMPNWFKTIHYALSGDSMYSGKIYKDRKQQLPSLFTSGTHKYYNFSGSIYDDKITGNFTVNVNYHDKNRMYGMNGNYNKEANIEGYANSKLEVPISILVRIGTAQSAQCYMFRVNNGCLEGFRDFYETETNLRVPKTGTCIVDYYGSVDIYDDGELVSQKNLLSVNYFTTSLEQANAWPHTCNNDSNNNNNDSDKHMKINKELIKRHKWLSPSWLRYNNVRITDYFRYDENSNSNYRDIINSHKTTDSNARDIVPIDDVYLRGEFLQTYHPSGFCYKSIMGNMFIKWYSNGCVESLVIGDKTHVLNGILIHGLSKILSS